MRTKFITCIYSDLFGTELGGRAGRKDHYRMSLLSILKITNADFVCYTSDREYDSLCEFFYTDNRIDKERLNIVIYDLKNTKYSDLIGKVRDKEEVRKSDRCVEIQYSKFDWFRRENDNYDYYFWIDAGLSHTGLIPNKYLSGPGYRTYFESSLFSNIMLRNLVNYCEDKFVVIAKDNQRNFWDGTVNFKFYFNYDMSVHIIGGLFGGKRHLWNTVVEKFDEYLFLVLEDEKKMYHEENIMSLMYQNHKDWFKALNFDIWWHEDNHKEGTKEFFHRE